jgi:hypothetical protein
MVHSEHDDAFKELNSQVREGMARVYRAPLLLHRGGEAGRVLLGAAGNISRRSPHYSPWAL